MTERRVWLCEIDDDGILTFPDELIDLQGWKEGDDINFDIRPDGTVILTKVEPNATQDDQGEPSSADGN